MQIKLFILLFIISVPVVSQPRIADIHLDRRNVFDSTEADILYVKSVMNSLHIMTKPYVIEDELLFEEGDVLTEEILVETERNLRKTDLFTKVRIELDSVGYDNYDVHVITQDRWSLTPAVLFGTGGGESEYGGRISERNFIGTGTNIELEGLFRTENDIRWQGRAYLNMHRFFRSEYALEAEIQANRFRTDQSIYFYDPYRSTRDLYSYGVDLQNSYGQHFFYFNKADTFQLLDYHERYAKGYFSKAFNKRSRLFFTTMVEYNSAERGSELYRRAFDNSGKVLIQFSSLTQDFTTISKVNDFKTEDLTIGGYGRVILGKMFPIGSQGEHGYYIAGQGEQSYYDGDMYLFGQLTAGSSFIGSTGRYTYQEFLGLGFYRLSTDFLLAASFRQQTAWNWFALRQLVLDNDFGLRGYEANKFSGDNRVLGNVELRYFPNLDLWLFDLGLAAFYDVGTVWEQQTNIGDSQFHNSVGLGLRFHNRKTTGESSIFRIDLAFNLDERKFGSIIFTTNQLFSPIKEHVYKLPQIFGIEVDDE